MEAAAPPAGREPLAIGGGGRPTFGNGREHPVRTLVLMVMVVLFGVSYSIAGNIRAKVLGKYSGIITTVLNSITYVAVYFPVLWVRRRRGLVSAEQTAWTYSWRSPYAGCGESLWSRAGGWKYMFLGGLCDCVSQVLLFTSQAYVSLVAQVILHQMNVIYTAVWSITLLGSRYILLEVAGMSLSALGGAVTIISEPAGSSSPLHLAIFALSAAPPSLVLKELMFRRWAADARRGACGVGHTAPLDIWCVSSAAALFQLVWVIPVVALAAGREKEESETVTGFLLGAWDCLRDAPGSGCTGAWQSYAIYICFDILANVFIYMLMREGSALLAFVTLKVNVPLTAVLGLIRWPVVGAARLNAAEVCSLLMVCAGAALFFSGTLKRESLAGRVRRLCCFPAFEPS